MSAILNNKKSKKKFSPTVYRIFLFVTTLGLLFLMGLLAVGMLQQYNERRVESDSSWLYAVDGRGCNDLLNLSDEEFEKALSSDLENISSRKKKRIKKMIEEMQADERYSENCKFAQERLHRILSR